MQRRPVAVVAAERAAELNRLGLRQALERAALTERTYQLGAATQLDVIRVRQDVSVARAALISGDEQLRRTREALGLALGLPEEVGVSKGFVLDGLVSETEQICHRIEGIEQRPDLVAAQENAIAARESTRQASAGYLPALGLTSNLTAVRTNPGPARFATWSIGAVLSVPLWEGGSRGGLVTERAGIEKQSQEAAEGLRRSVAVEVERARRAEDVAKALVTAAREARDLAEKTDELTRKSFQIGRATSLELVQSAAVLRQAELTLALREFEWVQARLDAFMTEAQCEG